MTETSTYLSRMLVGCVMQNPECLAELLQSVSPTDLDPPYSQALSVIARMTQDHEQLDPWALQRACEAASPGLPHDFVVLTALEGLPASFGVYLTEFREGIARRRLANVSLLMGPAARMDDLHLGIERVKDAVAEAEAVLQPQALPLLDGQLLWDYVPPPTAVLLPGLLWRQARAIFTGFEGDGKSILLRQLAIAGAFGIHPFETTRRIKPIRTLYLDLENPPTQAQAVMRTMMETLRDRGVVPDHASFEDRFKYLCRTDGLDIVGRGKDRQFLTRAIATHKPDLLCIGPLYRLAAGGGDLDEATVGGVIDFLNHLRFTYDLAIAAEAHPPHGATDGRDGNARRVLRPSGSSAWMRFPEVGRGLRVDADLSTKLGRLTFGLDRWRGDRSPDMNFPNYIARATSGQVWFDDVSDQVTAQMGR